MQTYTHAQVMAVDAGLDNLQILQRMSTLRHSSWRQARHLHHLLQPTCTSVRRKLQKKTNTLHGCTYDSHKAKESAVRQGWRACIVWGLAALLVVLVHSLVVVGGVLRAPWHGVLGVLSLWVLCQVAGCIRNVVHTAFAHRVLVTPGLHL